MEYPNYSAGLISQSFWFVEMKKVIKLIDDGKSEEEIKKMCIDENLFGAAKEYRAKRIYGYIWNRAKRLDKTLIDLFCTSDLATQKVINLIAILRSDRLFFEFMFEVYREKNYTWYSGNRRCRCKYFFSRIKKFKVKILQLGQMVQNAGFARYILTI